MKPSRIVQLMLAGTLSFYIARWLIAIPLMTWVLKPPGILLSLFPGQRLVHTLVIILVTAFLEAAAICLCRKFLFRDSRSLWDALFFALGSSILDIAVKIPLVVPGHGLRVLLVTGGMAATETALAIAAHLLFTYIVWNESATGKDWLVFLQVFVLIVGLGVIPNFFVHFYPTWGAAISCYFLYIAVQAAVYWKPCRLSLQWGEPEKKEETSVNA